MIHTPFRELERRDLWKDIKEELEILEELRAYEDRHYYEPDWPSMSEGIAFSDKRLKELVGEYEKKFSRKLHKKYLERIFLS